jgi:hypothetical protein
MLGVVAPVFLVKLAKVLGWNVELREQELNDGRYILPRGACRGRVPLIVRVA